MPKICLVTGASSGIGFEVCQQLAEQKNKVFAIARSKQKLQQLEELHPSLIHAIPADLTEKDAAQKLIDSISSTSDGVDILLNNAGALVNKPFLELTKNDWQHMLDINLLAVVELTKAVYPLFNPGGHIVNISSMGGFQGSDKFPGLTAYSVAKGAVSILSECLAAELTEKNIRVNALCLGSVQTDMFEKAFPEFEAAVSPGKMGTYIADFALNGSTFYNGRVLPVALSNPS